MPVPPVCVSAPADAVPLVPTPASVAVEALVSLLAEPLLVALEPADAASPLVVEVQAAHSARVPALSANANLFISQSP
jgi:hypothetical protein